MELTFTVSIDESKQGTGTVSSLCGITEDRADELMCDYKNHEGESAFATVIDKLKRGELSGNDILFYIVSGYKAMPDMGRVIALARHLI